MKVECTSGCTPKTMVIGAPSLYCRRSGPSFGGREPRNQPSPAPGWVNLGKWRANNSRRMEALGRRKWCSMVSRSRRKNGPVTPPSENQPVGARGNGPESRSSWRNFLTEASEIDEISLKRMDSAPSSPCPAPANPREGRGWVRKHFFINTPPGRGRGKTSMKPRFRGKFHGSPPLPAGAGERHR